ncbi:MAG: disulfide bond formation protein B [Rhodobacterales bacterium]|nr:MAG: disulfide bond formation protein B [Rhodobacterales bacterium]
MSIRPQIAVLTAASVLVFLGAWGFEALGYAPCQLCYWQRYPHYAAAAIGVVALLLPLRFFAYLGALALGTTSAVGFYHTGVERHWWPGPASCTGGGVDPNLSAADLLEQLQTAPLVRCDEIPWRLSDWVPLEFLDLTMANFNAVGSLVLALAWLAVARSRG